MMARKDDKNEDDEWELHPLFLSKIPNKKDIDKNEALSALITLINEEEEKEVFSYEPRRKNLKKKITEKGNIIYKKDRRNFYEPYHQNKKDNINYFEKYTLNKNADLQKENEDDCGGQDGDNIMNVAEQGEEGDILSQKMNNEKQTSDETSIGEVLVCLSMINLKQ
ncbi:hypothetical protein, conserved [Plasmodium gonderi]|uniref:Uncharacterized protein n=1 Tax=Plasmodium gonderi TaxID=77519 RepID=A0A1Y1JIF7_PLAGO|nr:hypothetical protein, conserved [Plasmodium gonderi]GAW80223.1 hypothetical protein, conserved [Plasmodium gonderi]